MLPELMKLPLLTDFSSTTAKCTQEFAEPSPHLTRWLRSIVELAKKPEFAPGTPDPIPRLIKANIKRQVEHISKTSIVKNATVDLHAFLYGLEDGVLEVL